MFAKTRIYPKERPVNGAATDRLFKASHLSLSFCTTIFGFTTTILAYMLDSLVRVSRRVRCDCVVEIPRELVVSTLRLHIQKYTAEADVPRKTSQKRHSYPAEAFSFYQGRRGHILQLVYNCKGASPPTHLSIYFFCPPHPTSTPTGREVHPQKNTPNQTYDGTRPIEERLGVPPKD